MIEPPDDYENYYTTMAERWRDGRCQSCGGKFLIGAAAAEYDSENGEERRICFFCWESTPVDPPRVCGHC